MKRPETPADRRFAFESFEDRLALTAQALSDLADEWRDTPIQTLAGATSSSGEGHGWAEVAYARNEFGLRGDGQTVAVIDSGIAYDHIALGGGLGAAYKVVGGWDFAENDTNPYDDGPAGFHGTHVAGIIGSGDRRYAGVAPDVDLVALRVFDDNGGGTLARVEEALRWVHQNRNAYANPITTVNLSLGTAWNSSNVPDWAVLEDEFRQLEQDGIFIAVAAGNSFATYRSAGLSYPAASQYVVPVASINASGQFSAFSQRSERVLAAPGEKIMSTLPDHFYGGDGVKNDFGATSGTSMAAPYVAGASVLLREAMTAMGRTNVTQDVLYDWLKNTSDTLYDSATNANYSRLNLQRALDTLVGVDDFGSTAGEATSLGTLTSSITVSGTIGRVSDSDFFRFTAAASGEVTFTLNTTGELDGKWETPDGGTVSGQQVKMNVVTGQSYRLGLGTSDGIGKFTIEARLTSGSTQTPPPPTTPNLVTVAGNQVQVGGTAGNDTYVWTHTGSQQQLTVNGVSYTFAANSQVQIQAGGGTDSITIRSSSGADVITTRAGSLDLVGSNYRLSTQTLEQTLIQGDANDRVTMYDSAGIDFLEATSGWVALVGSGHQTRVEGVRNVTVVSQGGGDIARLSGSAGNDRLTIEQGTRTLVTASTNLRVENFSTVAFYGLGGADAVEITGVNSSDQLYGRRGIGRYTAAGYRTEFSDVDQVLAQARTGQSLRSDVRAVDYLFRRIAN